MTGYFRKAFLVAAAMVGLSACASAQYSAVLTSGTQTVDGAKTFKDLRTTSGFRFSGSCLTYPDLTTSCTASGGSGGGNTFSSVTVQNALIVGRSTITLYGDFADTLDDLTVNGSALPMPLAHACQLNISAYDNAGPPDVFTVAAFGLLAEDAYCDIYNVVETPITGAFQAVGDIQVKFNATTGHNDYWLYRILPPNLYVDTSTYGGAVQARSVVAADMSAAVYKISGSTFAWSDGNGNTIVGINTSSHSIAGGNTFIGRDAGTRNHNAQGNTYVGQSAGSTHNGNGFNTVVGDNAFAASVECGGGDCWDTGDFNTMIGGSAGSISTGSANTFVGFAAGAGNVGNGNTYIGYGVGSNGGIQYEESNTMRLGGGEYTLIRGLTTNGEINVGLGAGISTFTSTGELDLPDALVSNNPFFADGSKVYLNGPDSLQGVVVKTYSQDTEGNTGAIGMWTLGGTQDAPAAVLQGPVSGIFIKAYDGTNDLDATASKAQIQFIADKDFSDGNTPMDINFVVQKPNSSGNTNRRAYAQLTSSGTLLLGNLGPPAVSSLLDAGATAQLQVTPQTGIIYAIYANGSILATSSVTTRGGFFGASLSVGASPAAPQAGAVADFRGGNIVTTPGTQTTSTAAVPSVFWSVSKASATPANAGTVTLSSNTLATNFMVTDGDTLEIVAVASATAANQAKVLDINVNGTRCSGTNTTSTRTQIRSVCELTRRNSNTLVNVGWNTLFGGNDNGATTTLETISFTAQGGITITVTASSAAGVLGDVTLKSLRGTFYPGTGQ